MIKLSVIYLRVHDVNQRFLHTDAGIYSFKDVDSLNHQYEHGFFFYTPSQQAKDKYL